MKTEIDANRFSQKTIELLVDFVSFWKNNENEPDFPKEMNEEEWFEQFLFFCESKINK